MRLKQFSAEIWLNKTRTLYRLAAKRCPKSTEAAQLTGISKAKTDTNLSEVLSSRLSMASIAIRNAHFNTFLSRTTNNVSSEEWGTRRTSYRYICINGARAGPARDPSCRFTRKYAGHKDKRAILLERNSGLFSLVDLAETCVSGKFEKTTKQEMMRIWLISDTLVYK